MNKALIAAMAVAVVAGSSACGSGSGQSVPTRHTFTSKSTPTEAYMYIPTVRPEATTPPARESVYVTPSPTARATIEEKGQWSPFAEYAYITMQRAFVAQVPQSRPEFTAAALKADIEDQYSVTLPDAKIEEIRREILR